MSSLNEFEQCLERLRIASIELKEMASSGRERATKYCEFLRQNIEISAESKEEELLKLEDQSEIDQTIKDIYVTSERHIDEITAYEEDCLSGQLTNESSNELLQYVRTFSEKYADVSLFSQLDMVEVKKLLTEVHEYSTKLRHMYFNWRYPKFTDSSDPNVVSFLNFESCLTFSQLNKLQEVIFSLPAGYNHIDSSHVERIANGNYFVFYNHNNKYWYPDSKKALFLFDMTGALLYMIESETKKWYLNLYVSMCHVDNVVVLSHPDGLFLFNCNNATINMIAEKQTFESTTFNSVAANRQYVFQLENGYRNGPGGGIRPSIFVYNWSLELVRFVCQNSDPTAPFYLNKSMMNGELFVSKGTYVIATMTFIWCIDERTGTHNKFETERSIGRMLNSRKELMLMTENKTIVGYSLQGKRLYENRLCDCPVDSNTNKVSNHVCLCPHVNSLNINIKIREDDLFYLVNRVTSTVYL